jgi:hypothetical protein
MESSENKRFVYEFGRFVLDPREKTLLIDGEAVHLPAKEFETLLLLVENNGRALSKEQMMSALWHDAFVEESNLAKQVSKLRSSSMAPASSSSKLFPNTDIDSRRLIFRSSIALPESSVIAERRTVRRVTMTLDNDAENHSRNISLFRRSGRPRTKTFAALAAIVLMTAVGILWYWNRDSSITPSQIKSIAILPLKPLTPGEDTNALGVGLTDSLITEIGSCDILSCDRSVPFAGSRTVPRMHWSWVEDCRSTQCSMGRFSRPAAACG